MMDVGPEALDLLTMDEVATRLRCSPKTVQRLVYAWLKAERAGVPAGDRPGIESVKVETLRRIDPEAVIEYKKRLRGMVRAPARDERDAAEEIVR
jgi:DNA-directed RNA polymerase specialized sigma24 family protein